MKKTCPAHHTRFHYISRIFKKNLFYYRFFVLNLAFERFVIVVRKARTRFTYKLF